MTILNQQVANSQTRSGWQAGLNTGAVNPLWVDEYGGEVETRILKESFMAGFVPMKTIRGTDTLTNDRMGFSTLQKVTRGIRPVDNSATFDNISIKVDTVVLARTTSFLLEEFQEHIDTRKEVGKEHGRSMGKFIDESFLVQGIKASQITNRVPTKSDPTTDIVDGYEDMGGWSDVIDAGVGGGSGADSIVRTAPEGFQGATTVQLGAEGDEMDPVALELAIQDLCQGLEEKDQTLGEAVLLLRPAQYYTLLKNDKLMSKDFSSDNGDYAKGMVLRACDVRVQTTNRFPLASEIGVEHYLSNAGNNYAYNVTATDFNCVCVLLMPKALLAGETIPLTSKVFYSELELQWIIQSYVAFGVTPNRAEAAGGVFRSDVTSTTRFGNARGSVKSTNMDVMVKLGATEAQALTGAAIAPLANETFVVKQEAKVVEKKTAAVTSAK